jgi:uncharacterized protein
MYMRALCVADIHGDRGALAKLRNAVSGMELDYVFLLGDYSRGFKDAEENRRDVLGILDILSEHNVKAIPGNCDQPSSVALFERRNASIHNMVLKLPEANIIGFGGSNTTPFNTPIEFAEEKIAENLEALYAMADKSVKTVVLSHFPPKDTRCDLLPSGLHAGSSALRTFIMSKKPELVLCSHIHECGGQEDVIGKTRIINLGRLSEGRAYILTAEDALDVELFTG